MFYLIWYGLVTLDFTGRIFKSLPHFWLLSIPWPALQAGNNKRTLAMFTLYRIGFCSVSKVAPVQCEQELMFCCGAEIVPKRSQCEQKPYPLCNLQRSLLI